MKTVLLTGAAGFIGRHCLAPLLGRGYEVHAVSSRPMPADAASPVRWHQVDLLHPEQVRRLFANVRPTHLLHLAWYTTPGKYWTSTRNLDWVRASVTLMQEFGEHGGQRAVMAGSCAEYDWKFGFCSEQFTPCVPASLYGASKHAARILLDAWSGVSGVSSAWGRLFFLYGPHESEGKLVTSVATGLLRDKPAHCTAGNQVRDYLHVTDAAAAFAALLDTDVAGPVNIASGTPVTVKTLVEKIAGKLGRPELLELGALPDRAGEPIALYADVDRLRQEVGFRPLFDLDSGIEQTLSWVRAEMFHQQDQHEP